MKEQSFLTCQAALVNMNNDALCMHQSMVFHSGVIEKNDRLVASVHCLHGVQQCLGICQKGKNDK